LLTARLRRYNCCVIRHTLGLALLAASIACSQSAPASSPNTPPPETPPQPSSPPSDATAGSSGVGRIAGSSEPLLDPISLIGTWSFDRTCASEDGITLAADGTAGTDQGSGMWAVDLDQRLVIIVREQEMGKDVDRLAERIVWRFTPKDVVGDDLVGTLDARRMGEKPIAINAKRCPAPK
jgi:hypothetical protein